MADATYIEPIKWQTVAKIIEKERPDALLPTWLRLKSVVLTWNKLLQTRKLRLKHALPNWLSWK